MRMKDFEGFTKLLFMIKRIVVVMFLCVLCKSSTQMAHHGCCNPLIVFGIS